KFLIRLMNFDDDARDSETAAAAGTSRDAILASPASGAQPPGPAVGLAEDWLLRHVGPAAWQAADRDARRNGTMLHQELIAAEALTGRAYVDLLAASLGVAVLNAGAFRPLRPQ